MPFFGSPKEDGLSQFARSIGIDYLTEGERHEVLGVCLDSICL